MSLKSTKTHRNGVEEGEFNYQTTVEGRTHDIPVVAFWDPRILQVGAHATHFYGGLGAERRGTKASVRRLVGLGLPETAGVILDFTHLPPEPANIQRIATEVPLAAAEAFNEAAGLLSGNPVDVLGHSQGGLAILLAAGDAPERFGAIAPISAPGLAGESFGKSPEEKRRKFIGRYLQNAFLKTDQSLFFHPDNLSSIIEGSSLLMGDLIHARLFPKIDLAMSLDKRDTVSMLAEDHPVRIFLAEHDPIFRLEEHRRSLGEVDLGHLIEAIPGSHTFPTSSTQVRQFAPPVRWLNAVSKQQKN